MTMALEIKRDVLEYSPCQICSGHPKYPGVLPFTLHRGGECMICHGKRQPAAAEKKKN